MTDYTKPLKIAADLVAGDRAATYGDARELHEHAARIFNVMRGRHELFLSGSDIALVLFAVKLARAMHLNRIGSEQVEDSVVDGLAYLSIWHSMKK